MLQCYNVEMRRPGCCYILSSIYLVDWIDPGLVLASGWRAGPVVMLIPTVSSQARQPLGTEGRGRGYVGSLAWVGSDHEPASLSQTYARSEYKDNPPLFV